MLLTRSNASASLDALLKPLRLCTLVLSALVLAAAAQAQTATRSNDRGYDTSTLDDSASQGGTAQGPVRLRQPSAGWSGSQDAQDGGSAGTGRATAVNRAPYQPSEFERYVQTQANAVSAALPGDGEIRRFGADLVTDPAINSSRQDPLPGIPGDYVVKTGDEVMLTIWGSADADLRLTVDRSGRITVPRVGAIQVAGVRHAELADTISRRVAQVFRNFQLTATLGQLRAVRVFVTGYALRPGSLTVNGMSSVLHVIMRSGGPSAAGSFRDIQLRRAGREVARFDLYDLLMKGDRRADQIVQADDVIHIGPVGPQVGVIGSVNQQAVFELRQGETLGDALRMAGGLNAVADRSRVVVERLADRASGRVAEFSLPQGNGLELGSGDLVRVFSAISAALPRDRQNKRVHVEGEVVRPGDYVLPPGSSLADAIRAAGGLTPAAYLYSTEFTRESVRLAQQQNFDRALRDLETDLAKNSSSRRVATTEEATALSASEGANARLIDRLRTVRPTGRVVLQLSPDTSTLPELALEDGDRINIPPRSSSVGVFGSVFNAGSYVFSDNQSVDYYLKQAGGPSRGADAKSMFLIRGNGTVVSARQLAGTWGGNGDFLSTITMPGDTLFVPEEMNKTTFVQDAKDWTQILYQFGLGLAGIKSLGL